MNHAPMAYQRRGMTAPRGAPVATTTQASGAAPMTASEATTMSGGTRRMARLRHGWRPAASKASVVRPKAATAVTNAVSSIVATNDAMAASLPHELRPPRRS